MDTSQFITAFDEIVETYKHEASVFSQNIPDELLGGVEPLYTAQLHAFESIRQLIIDSELFG